MTSQAAKIEALLGDLHLADKYDLCLTCHADVGSTIVEDHAEYCEYRMAIELLRELDKSP